MRAGLTTEDDDQPWLLEAQQGDRISGKISRAQVASVAVAALGTEASIGGCLDASGQLVHALGLALLGKICLC